MRVYSDELIVSALIDHGKRLAPTRQNTMFFSLVGLLAALVMQPILVVPRQHKKTIPPVNSSMDIVYSFPKIIHAQAFAHDYADARREAIRSEFAWSWNAYETHAFGHDELLPLSFGHRDWVAGGIGLTILDSLDSLWLLGFHDGFYRSVRWVETSLDFDRDAEVSTFETTIRVLGGLLSAHALSKEPILLAKAIDIGDRLLRAFDTASGLPTTKFNLRKGAAAQTDPLVLSEIGTLQLEFAALSAATGDTRYRAAVDGLSERLARSTRNQPLMPILLSSHDGSPLFGSMISLGAGGDSYYEYLLKSWLQTGRNDDVRRQRYALAAQAIRQQMVGTTPTGRQFMGERSSFGGVHPKQDHLACFVPGMLGLGAATGAVKAPKRHMALAKQLLQTCCRLYTETPTGLAAEISEFDLKGARAANGGSEVRSSPRDQHSLLRPETIESLFVMWRLTHEPQWRELGWEMFEAFRRHARLPTGGYASVESVYEVPVRHRDHMESFWLSETLKYFFLLFSDDDVLPLDQWVFNTEAHPLPVAS